MPTLQQKIAAKFLANLTEGAILDSERIEQLRKLLSGSKKLKADELVALFSTPAGDDVK